MFSHLRMTSICKTLAGYLHTTIPVVKTQNGLDKAIRCFAKWLIFSLSLLIKLHKYSEETNLSRNASNIVGRKEINPVETHKKFPNKCFY